MKNIEKTMESISGTVFLYCSLKDEESISFFTNAAEHTGRRLLRREDCSSGNLRKTAGWLHHNSGGSSALCRPRDSDRSEHRYLTISVKRGERHVKN